ncbi:MAG TPA: ABC transporter substrate-binding protein, partial [Candidatus Dormibacteraeota bacterium]|nr:ABC transporter substrate-binding protein [Candidatus Dormibacteraeota bacterium]
MRIVSLLPSATELLFAVGAGDEVVGVTHECDHPEAARRRPALTRDAVVQPGMTAGEIDWHIRAAVHAGSSIYALDEPLLRSLDPDLVVTQELCEVCAVSYRTVSGAVRRLDRDVRVLSLEPGGLEDILATVVAVGDATGHADGARRVAAEMATRMAGVRALPPPPGPPRVACIEWTDPVMAAGHWVPEMVAAAGGVDVLGSPRVPSTEVAWDAVVEAAPDVMVLMPCGHDLERTLA